MTPTTTLTFTEQREAQARAQEFVNRVAAEHGVAQAAGLVRMLATLDHAAFPQYDGYWAGDEWQPMVATMDMRSKGGLQAQAGDMVLARRNDSRLVASPADWTFYSVRLGWNCSALYGLRPAVAA